MVPNGPTDVATFNVSDTTGVTFSADSTEVAEIIFDSAATNSFNITIGAGKTFTISGLGVANNSGVTQNFSIGPSSAGQIGSLDFENAATAGTDTTYTVYGAASNGSNGSEVAFYGNSTASSATFIAQGATKGLDVGGGLFLFYDNATAENASFTINGAQNSGGYGGGVGFGDFSTAGNAVFVLNPATANNFDSGSLGFSGNATAGHGVFTLNGATASGTRTEVTFKDAATGGNGFFTVMGGKKASGLGGEVRFSGYTFTGLITTAGNATIINEGGTGAGSIGGITEFSTAATAGQALIVANGGEEGGGPGGIYFFGEGDGGEAQIELNDNGFLDISSRLTPSVTIGSLAGNGFAYLGSYNLTVGSNNLDTTFTGIIQENGGIFDNGSKGSFTKTGTGTLTLSGANTYTGGTSVSAGALVVSNTGGSATGTGGVTVNGGTLGGGGAIAGAVTVGTGSGSGATLQPSFGTNQKIALTIGSQLTFKSDGTYNCYLKSRRAEVIANGLTIESGAQFVLTAPKRKLSAGARATVISNTSENPISGTFANLPDGATIRSGGNTYQANYEGGDGNDLTLTVVP